MAIDLLRPLEILVADDHAVVREGLKRLLEAASTDWTVTEVPDSFGALEQLRRRAFDIAIFDLSMPGMGGLELITRVRTLHPSMPVLILTMRAEEHYARRAFEAGARAYITKDTAAQDLIAAVRKVAAGGVYVSASLAEHLVMHLGARPGSTSIEKLSDRELDVMRRLVAGQTPTEIAAALHLSIKTVSSHKSRIHAKLELPSLAALVRFGLENGLGDDDARPLAAP